MTIPASLLVDNPFRHSCQLAFGSFSKRSPEHATFLQRTMSSFPINFTAVVAFMTALDCPKFLYGDNQTLPSICGAANNLSYPFVRCDNLAGPMFAIENVPLPGTLSGPLFSAMGDVWIGLFLKNASLTGTLPSELARLTNLRFLDLSGNQLAGVLPSQPSAPRMEDFRVTDNRLSGTIPNAYLSEMPNLVRLHFGQNQFSGSLPFATPLPPSFNSFFANHNNLSGTLAPWPWVSWNNSGKWFSVAANQLSGTLPPSIFTAGSFEFVRVDDNQFSGTVPSIAKQTSLVRLNLSFNDFTGTLTLPLINECFIAGNKFSICSQPSGGRCCNAIRTTTTTTTTTTQASLSTADPTTTELPTASSTLLSEMTDIVSAFSAQVPPFASAPASFALIGGITVALVAVLLILGLVIVFLVRRRRISSIAQPGAAPTNGNIYGDVDDVRRAAGVGHEYESTSAPLTL